MDKQKQIEEMASIICKETSNKGLCEKCDFKKHEQFGYTYQCHKFDNAEALYNAGYRKVGNAESLESLCYAKGECSCKEQAVKEVLGKLKERFVRQEERFATNVTKFETDLNKVAENDLANAKYIIGKATGQATMAEKAQYYIDEIAKEMGVEL